MTNNKQQTAVEWLENQLLKQKSILKNHFEEGKWNDDRCSEIDNCLEFVKQAKEMEKERLIDAFDEGQEYEHQYLINSTPKFDSKTWYNETYGGGEQ